jgi:Family of unknown function (DUF5519)
MLRIRQPAPKETIMKTTSPATTVLDDVTTWPGISTQLTPRGSTAIVFEEHEIGHVHPDRGTLDMPLPDDRRADVLNAGRAKEWFSGWVSKPLKDDADAQDGIALLRGSYDELHIR